MCMCVRGGISTFCVMTHLPSPLSLTGSIEWLWWRNCNVITVPTLRFPSLSFTHFSSAGDCTLPLHSGFGSVYVCPWGCLAFTVLMVAIQLAGLNSKRASGRERHWSEEKMTKRESCGHGKRLCGLIQIACYAVCDRTLLIQKRFYRGASWRLSKTIAMFFSEQNEYKNKLMEKRER